MNNHHVLADEVAVDLDEKYPLVEVLWDDCGVALPWMTPQEAVGLLGVLTRCRSVGYLLTDKPEGIVIVSTLGFRDDTEMVHTTSVIPRGQMRRVRTLTAAEKVTP